MKTMMMVAMMVVGCFASVRAQEVQVDPIGAVDLAKLAGNVRAGYLFGKEKLSAAYLPLVTLRGHSGVEYVNLDSGVGFKDGVGKPIVALGCRADSLLSKIGAWKPVITTAILPPLETGPTALIDLSDPKPLKSARLYWLIALKLGK